MSPLRNYSRVNIPAVLAGLSEYSRVNNWRSGPGNPGQQRRADMPPTRKHK